MGRTTRAKTEARYSKHVQMGVTVAMVHGQDRPAGSLEWRKELGRQGACTPSLDIGLCPGLKTLNRSSLHLTLLSRMEAKRRVVGGSERERR